MVPEIDIPLSFDGTHWVAGFNENLFRASDLTQLEKDISEAIRHIPGYTDKPIVNIRLVFDNDSLPGWLRQYHTHYFNYLLIVRLPVSSQTTVASRY